MEEANESLFSGKISPGNRGKSNNKGVKEENSSCWIETLSHPQLRNADTIFLKRTIKYGVISTDEYRIGFFPFFFPPKVHSSALKQKKEEWHIAAENERDTMARQEVSGARIPGDSCCWALVRFFCGYAD